MVNRKQSQRKETRTVASAGEIEDGQVDSRHDDLTEQQKTTGKGEKG